MGDVISLADEREKRGKKKATTLILALQEKIAIFKKLSLGEKEKQRGRYSEELKNGLSQLQLYGFHQDHPQVYLIRYEMGKLGLLQGF